MAVVDEADSAWACAATRHLDSFTGTKAILEVHHIEPFSRVREHRFENLIPLCPNCHRKADRGEITSWVLTQNLDQPVVRRVLAPLEKKLAKITRARWRGTMSAEDWREAYDESRTPSSGASATLSEFATAGKLPRMI